MHTIKRAPASLLCSPRLEIPSVKLIQSLCQNFRIFLIYHMAGVVQLLQLRLLDVLGQEMS